MNLLKKHFGTAAALLIGLLFCGIASATPVRFDIDGHFSNIDIIVPVKGTFTGTMDVDTDTGELLAIDVWFPALSPFTDVQDSFGGWLGAPHWTIDVTDGAGDLLSLAFTTPQVPPVGVPGFNIAPGSLVDFAGGSIVGNGALAWFQGSPIIAAGFSGSITPAQANVPEPAVLGMFGFGALLVGVFAGLRRRVQPS
jgi:hypothetical protein